MLTTKSSLVCLLTTPFTLMAVSGRGTTDRLCMKAICLEDSIVGIGALCVAHAWSVKKKAGESSRISKPAAGDWYFFWDQVVVMVCSILCFSVRRAAEREAELK